MPFPPICRAAEGGSKGVAHPVCLPSRVANSRGWPRGSVLSASPPRQGPHWEGQALSHKRRWGSLTQPFSPRCCPCTAVALQTNDGEKSTWAPGSADPRTLPPPMPGSGRDRLWPGPSGQGGDPGRPHALLGAEAWPGSETEPAPSPGTQKGGPGETWHKTGWVCGSQMQLPRCPPPQTAGGPLKGQLGRPVE